MLKLHSFLGLFSGIFVLLMSLSGAMLVFHEEMDALQYPGFVKTEKPLLTVDSCYTILKQQFPHGEISSCEIPSSTARPFLFSVYDSSFEKGSAVMQVFLHPQTGTILEKRGASNNFTSWLAGFHSSFHLGKTGEWLLGFFAIIFLLSICTGLILFRKNIIATLLFKKSALRKGRLHQVIGVYALLFNLLIGITGFWMQRYVFKKDFYQSSNYTPVIRVSPASLFRFDSSFNNLRRQFPDFTAAVIYFAQSSHGKTAVYGSRARNSFIHSKQYADVIFLDSAGQVAKTRFINEISSSDRYDIINSQLHFGQYGGWPVKIVYSLFGITGALLSITGFLLWRRKGKKDNKQ